MTIEEYFSSPSGQPVDDTAIQVNKSNNHLLYASVYSIDFIAYEHYYAKILIAHPAPDIWAFGYEIKDGFGKAIIRRKCSPEIVTRGKIDKLVYGMTKVLKRKLSITNSKTIRTVVNEAEKKALTYYVSRNTSYEKITI